MANNARVIELIILEVTILIINDYLHQLYLFRLTSTLSESRYLHIHKIYIGIPFGIPLFLRLCDSL